MECIQFLMANNLGVALTAPAALCRPLAEFLQQSFYLQPAWVASDPVIYYRFLHQSIPVAECIVGDTPIYQSHDLSVWQSQTGFRLWCGDTTLCVEPATGEAVGWLAPSFWSCCPRDQRDFFLISLLMLCHRQQCYGLHANGLSDNPSDNQASTEHGYLLVGNSGSGKTTLAMSLVRQGWRYLGDDVILLSQGASGIQAYALRRDFACTPTTLAHIFTHTTPAPDTIVTDNPMAKQIIPEIAFQPAHFQPVIWPKIIYFTQLAQQPQSQLRPIPQTQSLISLAQQSAGIMTDRRLAEQQMAFLKQLTSQARIYELCIGFDVFTDPTAVASLLQRGA